MRQIFVTSSEPHAVTRRSRSIAPSMKMTHLLTLCTLTALSALVVVLTRRLRSSLRELAEMRWSYHVQRTRYQLLTDYVAEMHQSPKTPPVSSASLELGNEPWLVVHDHPASSGSWHVGFGSLASAGLDSDTLETGFPSPAETPTNCSVIRSTETKKSPAS